MFLIGQLREGEPWGQEIVLASLSPVGDLLMQQQGMTILIPS